MSKFGYLLVLAVAAAGLVVFPAGAVRTDNPVLTATVGSPSSSEAFVINLTDASGNPVSHLDPGTYTINVTDYAESHNFHLSGPGVDESTAVDATGQATWTVTFTDGTYRYICDAHPNVMHKTFTVGNVPTPTTPAKLNGRVGPGKKISLTTASGSKVKTLAAATYRLTVKDASRTDNFHLTGPGVNKKTGIASRGTATWKLALRKGIYRYRSDAHAKLNGRFSVIVKPLPAGAGS